MLSQKFSEGDNGKYIHFHWGRKGEIQKGFQREGEP